MAAVAEYQEVMALAKQKKINLPACANENQIMLRFKTLYADNVLKGAVSEFVNYVDSDGKAGTSPGGLMISVNKKIKQEFSKPVKEIYDERELAALAAVRETIASIIASGQEMGRTRKEIRQKCYEAIGEVKSLFMGDVWRN
jgi:hypothetical protein